MKIISAKRSRTPINSSGSLSDGNKVAAVTYDVLYDELVRGQQCVEKNVPAHRLVSSKQVMVRNQCRRLVHLPIVSTSSSPYPYIAIG